MAHPETFELPAISTRASARHTFATLEDALAFAKGMARKHQGVDTVSIIRSGRFYAVRIGRPQTQTTWQAYMDGVLVGAEQGFTLLEVLISTSLAMLVIGALTTVLLANARLAATLAKTSQEESQARARLSRQLVDLSTPIDGVTVTRDDATPADQPCQLFHLVTTTPSGKTLDGYASRGCTNQ